MSREDLLSQVEGFEWDEGNVDKNWRKHGVSFKECQQLFNNSPLMVKFDELHSKSEKHFQALGLTDKGRRLFLVFTFRKNKIRVISARNQSKLERSLYEEYKKEIEINS